MSEQINFWVSEFNRDDSFKLQSHPDEIGISNFFKLPRAKLHEVDFAKSHFFDITEQSPSLYADNFTKLLFSKIPFSNKLDIRGGANLPFFAQVCKQINLYNPYENTIFCFTCDYFEQIMYAIDGHNIYDGLTLHSFYYKDKTRGSASCYLEYDEQSEKMKIALFDFKNGKPIERVEISIGTDFENNGNKSTVTTGFNLNSDYPATKIIAGFGTEHLIKHKDFYWDDYVSNMAAFLLGVFTCLLSVHPDQQTKITSYYPEPHPAKKFINKKREAKGKLPIIEWRIVDYVPTYKRYHQKRDERGSRSSPRAHERRQHQRRLASGKIIQVRSCKIGATTHGEIHNNYVVKAA